MAAIPETSELILHEMHMSGNCYKIRLTASLLGLKINKLLEYDVLKKETRTSEYLSNVNADGRVPVLQIGSDIFLPESNAACYYLADSPTSDRKLIPTDRLVRARMLQWMFFEQYSHEPCIAVLRFWRSFLGEENLSEAQKMQLPAKKKQAEDVLGVMERHLGENEWFAGEVVSLADVALFAYTHRLHESGLDVAKWPAVKAWCEKVTKLEGYVRMED